MANTKVPIELSSTPGIVDNSNATAITIDSAGAATFSGNLGIGVDAPLQALHVNSGTGNSAAIFESTDSTSQIWLKDSASSTTYQTGIGCNGDNLLFNNGGEKMRLDASGKLSINTTSTTAAYLKAAGVYGASYAASFLTTSASTTAVVVFENTNGIVGNIGTGGVSTSYNTSSDYRLKEDDVPMTGATERVKALRPINFAWKVDGSRTDGFFAHEAQEVVPEAVHGTKDAMRDEEYEVTPAVEEVRDEEGNVTTEAVAAVMGTRSVPDYQGIDQSKLVPLLTATIQELIARIEALEGA